MKRFLLLLLAAICLLTGCGASVSGNDFSAVSEPIATPQPSPTPEPVRSVRFSASGDNLIHGSIYLQAQRRTEDGSYNFAPLYEEIAPFYQNYDLNMINQETLVNDQLPPSSYPCFSTPGALGQAAYDAGFRLFAGANNHTYDQSSAGLAATQQFWAEMPEDSLFFGVYPDEAAEQAIPLYTQNGMTFACLAYTDHTNGIPQPPGTSAHVIYTSQREKLEQQIRAAKELADVVLVSVHWGVEDSHRVTDVQRELAQNMTDWGADAIIGTHPHVIQPIEWLTSTEDGSETICAYSLGNFVSAQSKPDQMIGSVLTFLVTQQGDADAEISEVQIHPTVTHYDARYSNIRVLLLADYTEERALQHGVRSEYPAFDASYIQQVVNEFIPAEFLAA